MFHDTQRFIRVLLILLLTATVSVPSYAVSALETLRQEQSTSHESSTHAVINEPKAKDASSQSILTPPNPSHVNASPHSKYALIYIFSSECPFCHQFTPKLMTFLGRHPDLQHYAFSMDGKGLMDFKHPMPATKEVIHHFFGTPHFVYPATFFVNTETNKFTGLTYQNVDLSVLEARYEQLVTNPNMLQALN